MKSRELVPLINSSAFHQSDMKCNHCSKKPKCSVMGREEEEMHHPSSNGQRHFSGRDPGKALYLHRVAEKHCFQKPRRGFHGSFLYPREILHGHNHVLSLYRHTHEDCAGTANTGLPPPCALTEAFQPPSHRSKGSRVTGQLSESVLSTTGSRDKF